MLQHKIQFGDCPHRTNYAKHSQEEVPESQSVPELEWRTGLHDMLTDHDEEHVGTDVVEGDIPVFMHPLSSIIFSEIFLKLKHIGIIWHRDRYRLHFERVLDDRVECRAQF